MFGTVATPQSQDEPGFTQMFESLGAHAEVPKAAAISTDSGKDQRSVPAAQGSGGEFTQLLRKLDEPQKQETYPMPALYAKSKASQEPQQFGGGFTQLLRTLSRESNEEMPAERLQPVVQQTNEVPGEFTRTISRSALREAEQKRRVAPEPAPAPNPSQVPPPTPVPEMQAPPVSPQNILANAQSLANMAGMTPPSVPMMPAAITPALPTVPLAPVPASAQQQTQPGGKLQQYLPLLLTGNMFLMLLILALIVFLLVRSH
jgi:hypothetical protein